MRVSPDAAVRRWVQAHANEVLWTTAITVAEVRYGIARLPAGRRKELLRDSADEVFARFEAHILPFDTAAAGHYALLVAARDEAGLPIDGFDAQIAAICRSRSAVLATRNVKDFQHTGIDVMDPWAQG